MAVPDGIDIVTRYNTAAHEILGAAMLGVVLHIAAALRHPSILKDGVLRRMW